MQISARLDRIEKRLTPQQPKQAYIILMAPGRFCEGWLVKSARNDERLINGEWVTVVDPESYATMKETYATKEQALEAIDQATSPVKPLILFFGEREQQCL
jgi:hypothetical protein